MNDILRIARLRIALQRAFLGRAILRVIDWKKINCLNHCLGQLMNTCLKSVRPQFPIIDTNEHLHQWSSHSWTIFVFFKHKESELEPKFNQIFVQGRSADSKRVERRCLRSRWSPTPSRSRETSRRRSQSPATSRTSSPSVLKRGNWTGTLTSLVRSGGLFTNLLCTQFQFFIVFQFLFPIAGHEQRSQRSSCTSWREPLKRPSIRTCSPGFYLIFHFHIYLFLSGCVHQVFIFFYCEFWVQNSSSIFTMPVRPSTIVTFASFSVSFRWPNILLLQKRFSFSFSVILLLWGPEI